jgi:hypothetical protein
MAAYIEDVLGRRVGLQLSEKYDTKIPEVTIWRNTWERSINQGTTSIRFVLFNGAG